PSRTSPVQLVECDLMLGLETNLRRNANFAQTPAIDRPFFRQIQPIGHRQTGMTIGKRQRYCDLAVFFLAKLAAILACNTNRMPPLLREPGIVDDPGFYRPALFYLRHPPLADLG